MTDFMQHALTEAAHAGRGGEIPVGAVLVFQGEVIAASGNRVCEDQDPTAHAEICVLRQGAKHLGAVQLTECDLYVTLEPCSMCAGAIAWARVRRLYFGAYDPKGGGVEHGARVFDHATCHHRPEIYGGVREGESAALLRQFFREKR